MLAASSAGATALSLALLLPALAPQSPDDTRADLAQDALRGLDVLRRIEQDLAAGRPAAREELRRMTEAPLLADRQRDELFEELRAEVARLLEQVEGGAAPAAGAGPLGTPLLPREAGAEIGSGRRATDAPGEALATPSLTGPANPTASESALDRLAALRRLPAAEIGAAVAAPGGLAGSAGVAAGSADPLRHAQALVRAGRPADALALLEGQGEGRVPLYWRARALEKLGRLSEARDLFRKVLEAEPGAETEFARLELEYLDWRLQFDAKAAAPQAAAQGGAPR